KTPLKAGRCCLTLQLAVCLMLIARTVVRRGCGPWEAAVAFVAKNSWGSDSLFEFRRAALTFAAISSRGWMLSTRCRALVAPDAGTSAAMSLSGTALSCSRSELRDLRCDDPNVHSPVRAHVRLHHECEARLCHQQPWQVRREPSERHHE